MKFLIKSTLYFTLLYISILFSLITFPSLQSLLVYLHWVRIPGQIDSTGLSFGFRAGTLRTLSIQTLDNKTLGAWHILPRRLANLVNETDSQMQFRFEKSLSNAERVFLYLHGNAGNRATFTRPTMYKLLTGLDILPDSHVLAIDYRGFGDSAPVRPTEEGLRIDAISSFNYLLSLGIPSNRIIIVGHSLGTGVASYLASYLSTSRENIPGGLVLLAAYSSIPDASISYPIVPLLFPFKFSQITREIAKMFLVEKWDSIQNIRNVSCPILIVHGNKDVDIHYSHSTQVFESALEARVERGLPSSSLSIQKYPNEGELWQADSIWYLQVLHGKHNTLVIFDLVMDTMKSWLALHLI